MSRKVKQKVELANMTTTNPEVAERHIAAYVYAATGSCSCPACVALRPLAKIFYEKYAEKKKVSGSGTEAQPSAQGQSA